MSEKLLCKAAARRVQLCAEKLGDGRADVAEAHARSQIDRTDLFAQRDHGNILAGVIGVLRVAGVAAVVGGDDDAVVVTELCEEAGQPAVELRQRGGVAVRVAAVAVEHIKVYQIHEAKTLEIASGKRQRFGQTVGIAGGVGEFGHALTGKNVVDLADSVFQVAANEELVPVQELYRYCEIAREMLKGKYGVGRVIARPFLGNSADTFYRTTNRHDLSLKPPRATMLDLLKDAGKDVIAVGKIYDIFDGEGVTEKIKTTGNTNGIAFTKALQTRDFEGLAFVNLVDFDMLYGHRRDVAGYAAAATEFDRFLADFLPGMREGDLLMITADHGCDPSYTKTTDHTREYVPYLVCGKGVKAGTDLGTKLCFGTIAQTICEYLEVDASTLDGKSVWQEIRA